MLLTSCSLSLLYVVAMYVKYFSDRYHLTRRRSTTGCWRKIPVAQTTACIGCIHSYRSCTWFFMSRRSARRVPLSRGTQLQHNSKNGLTYINTRLLEERMPSRKVAAWGSIYEETLRQLQSAWLSTRNEPGSKADVSLSSLRSSRKKSRLAQESWSCSFRSSSLTSRYSCRTHIPKSKKRRTFPPRCPRQVYKRQRQH